MPRILLQAIRPQHVERVRQDVHEPRGENDARGKGLDDHEEVPVRLQGRDPLGEEREADADHARD